MRENILDKIFEEIQGSKSLKRTENRMLIAQKIDMGMKAKGWNKSKFANEIGQKNSVITRWLSGTHNFTSDTLTDIEDILDINLLDTLIERSKVSNVVKVSYIPPKEYNIANIFQNSILINSTNNFIN